MQTTAQTASRTPATRARQTAPARVTQALLTMLALVLIATLRPAFAAQTQATIRVYDAETTGGGAQGDATLQGACFKVRDATGTVVSTVTTDESGYARVSGLDSGTYTVVCAPGEGGYAADTSWKATLQVSSTGAATVTEGSLTLPLTCKRSQLLTAKVDADTGEGTAQGDASLSGCEIEVVNRSARSVVVSGRAIGVGAVCCTMVTGTNGEATSTELPWGTYELREAKAPVGYTLNTTWSQTVAVRRDGAVLDLTAKGIARPKGTYTVSGAVALSDPVVRGGVRVRKADAETTSGAAQGAATLAGCILEICSRSTSPVVVDGVTYSQGDVVATLTTSEAGIAQTNTDTLPYGTYEVREKSAPVGYTRNSSWSATFQVRKAGELRDLTDTPCTDEVARGDLTLTKVDDATGEAMPQVAFLVRSRTTGEAHVLVCDSAGRISTRSAERPHTTATNASDKALQADGTLDETALDPSSGIWFTGGATEATVPDDTRGALPYDTYDVIELASAASAGHRLETREVTISRDGEVCDLGTIVDAVSEQLSTRLVAHQALALTGGTAGSDGLLSLTDDVRLQNLLQGRTYTLTGTLHLRGADGSDQGLLTVAGEPVRSSSTFVASESEMQMSNTFSFDATGLSGTTLVCFEELTDQDGTLVATHADIADEDQTVRIPGISTELTDATGAHETLAQNDLALTDTVSYAGLETGATYRLEATLADVATGETCAASDGTAIVGTTTFVPASSSGTETVEIALDASDLSGRTLVCLERLYRDDALVAEHADLADAAQSVTLPSLATRATADGLHVAEAKAEATVTDVVTYENLTPGATYAIAGTLHDKATGEAIATASATLVPESASGTAEVTFTCDLAGYAGRSLVCFEELSRAEDGAVIARHADLSDADQTILVSSVATELTDASTGEHVAHASGTVTLTDRVSYQNLTPGDTYALEGELLDVETGKTILDGEGTAVTAGASFVAERAAGTQTVTFTLDAGTLAGTTVVATERLLSEGQVIARHEDTHDPAQQVRFPQLATELTSADGTHEVTPTGSSLTLTDTVSFENLLPGLTFEITGRLVDATTGEAVTLADGTDAQTLTLTPTTSDGTCQMSFELTDDGALAGRTLVATEYLTLDGATVATHADLADPTQSVTFGALADITIDTVLHVTGTDSHEVPLEGAVRLTDTVTYRGLTAGATYELHAHLVDAKTAEPIRASVLTATDEQATAGANGGETSAAGTADDTLFAGLDDATVVWVEGSGVCHLDLTCEHIEDLTGLTRTTLGVARSTHKRACPHEETGGSTQTSTEGHTSSDGSLTAGIVAATFTFTPDASSGTVEVPLTLDATALAGHALVCFEELTQGGATVATHADIRDSDQTVTVAGPASSATSTPQTSAQTPATSTTSVPSATAQRTTQTGSPALAQTGRGIEVVVTLSAGCVLVGVGARRLLGHGRKSGGAR